MKKIFAFFLAYIMVFLLTSCGGSNKTAADRSEYEPSLIAYGYQVKDVGGGFSLGTLYLAFENTKSRFVPIGSSSWGYSVEDAYVETQEEKTYPIRVYADYGKFAKAEGNAQSTDNYISLSMPSMPPGFRINKWMSASNGNAGGNYVLEFRFATIAHPTKIVFPNKTEWNIVLNEVPNNLSMPIASSAENIPSLASFNGKVLLDNKDKLLITLGKCKIKSGTGYIEVVSYNRDNFYAQAEIINFPALAHVENGEVTYIDTRRINPNVGPGQTVVEDVWSFNQSSDYVIFYWSDGAYDVAKISGCQ